MYVEGLALEAEGGCNKAAVATVYQKHRSLLNRKVMNRD